MTAGGETENLGDAHKRDEANIRWLLAAVLHHEAPEELSVDEDE
jgi:hypothetical protein